MSLSDDAQMPGHQSNHPEKEDCSSNFQPPASPEDYNTISKANEQAGGHFKLWQTVLSHEDSKTSYKTGSAVFIGIPADGKPVIAPLLSYQLGQRTLKCVKPQRAHGELEGRSKIDIARIDKKISGLQQLVYSHNSALAMAEMSKHTPGQENQEKSRTRIIRIRERLSKAEEYISQLQKEEKSIEQNEKELREQWHDYMKDVSLGHDDAFIKAGILPDYTKDESKYVSGSNSSEEEDEEGAGRSKGVGNQSHESPPKETQKGDT